MFAAQTKPEDAASSLSAWAKLLGLEGLSSKISYPSIDAQATVFGALLVIVAISLWIWRRLKKQTPASSPSASALGERMISKARDILADYAEYQSDESRIDWGDQESGLAQSRAFSSRIVRKYNTHHQVDALSMVVEAKNLGFPLDDYSVFRVTHPTNPLGIAEIAGDLTKIGRNLIDGFTSNGLVGLKNADTGPKMGKGSAVAGAPPQGLEMGEDAVALFPDANGNLTAVPGLALGAGAKTSGRGMAVGRGASSRTQDNDEEDRK